MKEEILPYNLPKPAEIKHNNDDYALVDDSQVRGGLKVVNNITERNEIPLNKRGFGVVKYRDVLSGSEGSWVTKTYVGSDLSEQNWINETNWENITTEKSAIDVTHEELLNLISGNTISDGVFYLLSDFQDGITVTGGTEPLLLLGLNNNTLATEGWSTIYPNHRIFYDVNGTTNPYLKGDIFRRIYIDEFSDTIIEEM